MATRSEGISERTLIKDFLWVFIKDSNAWLQIGSTVLDNKGEDLQAHIYHFSQTRDNRAELIIGRKQLVDL